MKLGSIAAVTRVGYLTAMPRPVTEDVDAARIGHGSPTMSRVTADQDRPIHYRDWADTLPQVFSRWRRQAAGRRAPAPSLKFHRPGPGAAYVE